MVNCAFWLAVTKFKGLLMHCYTFDSKLWVVDRVLLGGCYGVRGGCWIVSRWLIICSGWLLGSSE